MAYRLPFELELGPYLFVGEAMWKPKGFDENDEPVYELKYEGLQIAKWSVKHGEYIGISARTQQRVLTRYWKQLREAVLDVNQAEGERAYESAVERW